MIPLQPKCICLECKSYSLVYSSVVDVHKCLECPTLIKAQHVEHVIDAFSVYTSPNPPILIPNYNAILCISCLNTGGISFRKNYCETSFCTLCQYSVAINCLHELIFNAFKTKLIEDSYNTKYTVFGVTQK